MYFKKIIYYSLNFLLLFSLFYIVTIIPSNINVNVKILLFSIGIILFCVSLLFKYLNKTKTYKLIYLLFILFTVVTNIYLLLYSLGFLSIFSDVTSLKNYILSTRELGVIIYILIQAAQVVILPIPAAVICIVGSLIYGPFLGAVYCTAGILIGSYISYFIGKFFGIKVVSWIVGKDNTIKYSNIIQKRGKLFLGLAFLLPMFPDDILCLIAGITSMHFSSFFWITFITRPIGVICMSYFSSGTIIPFTGWGIYAWCGILIVAITLVVLISKYQEKIQNFILNKILRRKRY